MKKYHTPAFHKHVGYASFCYVVADILVRSQAWGAGGIFGC